MVYPATKTDQTTTIFLLIKIAPNIGDNGILPGNFWFALVLTNNVFMKNDIQKRKQKQI